MWFVLNGKSYSLPFKMVFQKYYCVKCGAQLKKERTHRVVTKDDKDYYRYHDYGKFPRRDYDVYDYRFQCPACGTRSSFDEQCIIGRIQKKLGHLVLSSSEIKSNYKEAKASHHKMVLATTVLFPIVFALIGFILSCISNSDGITKNFTGAAIFFLASAVVMTVNAIRKYRGNYRTKFKYSYSYEKEAQFKRLHAYSSHNKDLIAVSMKCYCFYCKEVVDAYEITDYADNGQTAICPRCGIDSIIPDSIEEGVDNSTISDMNEYWF